MDDCENLPDYESLTRCVRATSQNQFVEFTEKQLLYLAGLVLVKSKAPLQRFAKAARVGMICRGYCLENVLIMRAVGDRMIIATPRVMKPGMLAGFPGESIG